jgi:predicted 3-demethylubiquinone-9 3-methyltransferase (glyoxalase superfamily)
MQKITPHLWYDKEAQEAAAFYVSTFKDSKQKDITTIHNTPSGSVDIVTIELMGQEFTPISAGPLFKFNPSVSFLVAFDSKDAVDAAWKSSRKAAPRSWNSELIHSVKDTGGYRTNMVCPGNWCTHPAGPSNKQSPLP